MRVRLTRKLAESVDGIDLSAHGVGDVVDVSPSDAQLLIAEKWAEEISEAREIAEDKGPQGRRSHRRKTSDSG